jgi:hypothetical protein
MQVRQLCTVDLVGQGRVGAGAEHFVDLGLDLAQDVRVLGEGEYNGLEGRDGGGKARIAMGVLV